jgi:hypothetical protein
VKPVAALVAITLVLLAGPMAGAAAGSADPVAAAPVRVEPGQVGPDQVPGPLRLDLTQVGPRVVTAGGPDALTVVGTLTNTGDRPVDDLVVRVQRGDPLRTEGELRDALEGADATDAVTPQFTPLPGELAPGGRVPVRLAVPLRGSAETGLALSAPGVYPLLVNVNGVPRDGDRARLAATRVLLPVLSLPAGPDGGDPVVPDPATATPFAMLYPITDAPRRLSTVPGEPALLTDDDLATALAPAGRLGGLLSALDDAAPAGSALRQAVCLALDPDLVETVAVMREGYTFRGLDGVPVPGTGAEVARAWLDRLTAVADGGCVLALPYADADLVALTRGGRGELATGAVAQGRQALGEVLGEELGASVPDDVTWPAAGLLDEPTLAGVAAAGDRTLLLSADAVELRTPRDSGVVAIESGVPGRTAVLTDPLLTAALTGPTAPGEEAARGSAAAVLSPAGGGGALATQDGLGALAFRAQGGADGADGPDGTTGDGPLVLAPPRAWGTDGPGARALLDGVGELVRTGALRPRAAEVVAPGEPTGPAGALAYPLEASGREVPPPVVDTISGTAAAVADLRAAARPGSPVGVSPEVAFAPLERGLVRPASTAWRGRPGAAETGARLARERVDALRATVRVLEPPGPYSLGTADAPLLITVANGLPVTIEVQVEIAPSPGLRVAPIEPQLIPPWGRRQASASTEVTRAGQFSVQASVRTPGGELLGPPSRLRMRSTAYGTITVWLTGSAGILLVVLAARRVVVRRRRGEPVERREIVLGPRPGSTPGSPPGPTTGPVPPSGTAPPAPDAATEAIPTGPGRTGDPFPDPDSTVRTRAVPPGPGAAATDRTTGATERLPARARPPRPRPPHPGPPRPPEPPRVGRR